MTIKFKAWLALFVFGGGIVFAASLGGPTDDPLTLVLPEKTITFAFTDDTEGENVLIYTDSGEYRGLGQVTVYVMIENQSGKRQKHFVLPSFERDIFTVERIAEYVGNEDVERDVYGSIPFDCSTSTSTQTCYEWGVTGSETVTVSKWSNLGRFNAKEYDIERKPHGRHYAHEFPITLSDGERRYFRIDLAFSYTSEPVEFWIETLGESKAYGHLDPTVHFSDDFNSYSTSQDLTAQSDWTDVTGDNFEVTATTGPVGDDNPNTNMTESPQPGNTNHRRVKHAFTAVTDDFPNNGTIATFWMNSSDMDGGSSCEGHFFMNNSGDPLIQISKRSNGEIWVRGDGVWSEDIATNTTLVDNTWHHLDMAWDFANNKHKARVDEGDWSDWMDFTSAGSGSGSQIDDIELGWKNDCAPGRFDNVSIETPDAEGGEPEPDHTLLQVISWAVDNRRVFELDVV